MMRLVLVVSIHTCYELFVCFVFVCLKNFEINKTEFKKKISISHRHTETTNKKILNHIFSLKTFKLEEGDAAGGDVWVCCGHGSTGWTTATATAEVLAQKFISTKGRVDYGDGRACVACRLLISLTTC